MDSGIEPDLGVGASDAAVDEDGGGSGAADVGVPDAVSGDADAPDVAGSADVGDGDPPDAGFCEVAPGPLPVGVYAVETEITECSAFAPECIESCVTSTVKEVLRLDGPGPRLELEYPSFALAPRWIESDRQREGPDLQIRLTPNSGFRGCIPGNGSFLGEVRFDVNLETGAVSAELGCVENNPGPCGVVPDLRYALTSTGTYRCVPEGTSCVGGDVVTCDARGVVTSSTSCGAPCAPVLYVP